MSPTLQRIFEDVIKGLPHFDDGRIDFTGVRKALVLTVVVYHKGEILIVKRSEKVSAFRGLWNGISGFVDEPKPIEDFARQELSEELSLSSDVINEIAVAEPYEIENEEMDKAWMVYPVLATLSQKPIITLDWEHTDFAWIRPDQLEEYAYVYRFDKNVEIALALRRQSL